MATAKDFQNHLKPNWCPGCGDFGVQTAMQRAFAESGKEPHEFMVVAGIGCSGRMSGYLHTNGFHGIHGRVLPLAQGMKLANRDLTVVATGGDGDGFAIGAGHTMHALRRNIDMTYIVMDNHIYGLTKGQASPHSDLGFKTKTTPYGAIESPLSVLQLALAAGATFVAQAFSKNPDELVALITAGIKHQGFSFINVMSPCVTYNKVNTYEWFTQHLVSLASIDGYDPTNKKQALSTLLDHDDLVTGLVYQDREKKSYQELLHGYSATPLVEADLQLSQATFEELLAEFG